MRRIIYDSQWRYASPLATPTTNSILLYPNSDLMSSLKRPIAKRRWRKAKTASSCVPFVIHDVITQEICQRQYWHPDYHVSIPTTFLESWGAARWKVKDSCGLSRSLKAGRSTLIETAQILQPNWWCQNLRVRTGWGVFLPSDTSPRLVWAHIWWSSR